MIALSGALDGAGEYVAFGSGIDLNAYFSYEKSLDDHVDPLLERLFTSSKYHQIHSDQHGKRYHFLENTHVIPSAEAHELTIASEYLWNRAIGHFSKDSSPELVTHLINELFDACIREKKSSYLYACYCMMLQLIENAGIQTLSLEDSRRLPEMLLLGLDILPHPCNYVISQEIYMKLMGYLDLKDQITCLKIDLFLRRNLFDIMVWTKHSPVSSQMARFIQQTIRIYNRILKHLDLPQTDSRSDVLIVCEKMLENESEIEDWHTLHWELLHFAEYLLSVDRYNHYGSRLLKAFEKNWLAAYSAIPRKPDPSFTATVICHLHVLLKNEDVPRADLLTPAMKGINISDLYRVYPDSLPMLINLMDYDPNHLKICFEKMAQFVEVQGETLPLSIYNDLCALAKKTIHGASLLAALNALLV